MQLFMPYLAGRFLAKTVSPALAGRSGFCAFRGFRGINVVNLSRKSSNYKFMRMQKPFVIP